MTDTGYSLTTLENFRGGLNYRTDAFNLDLNESPDLMNVSVDPRGGIALRVGVTSHNQTALSSKVKGMWSLYKDDGTNKVLVNYDTSIAAHDGTDFVTLVGPTARTAGSRVYGDTINNRAYGVSFDQPSFYYDGFTAADLGTTLDGSTGNFPQAKYVTHWNNFAWVGYTKESGTNYPTRIRYSHANLPEQWDDLDYIDIGKGEGGDYITGVLGHNDRLMIFKANSTYALFGFDGDSFQLVTISETVGMTGESSAVSTPYGVFFWSARQGVYLYDGTNMIWLFEKLQPAIDDGRISFINNPPQLGWANNKLYVSVDYFDGDANTTKRHVYVYDPTMTAWVLWDVDATALHTHHPPDGQPILYGACEDHPGRVVSIDSGETTADRYTYTGGAYVSTNIASRFQTSWVKTRNPIVRKRWGQMRLVTSAEKSGTLTVDVFHDYDTTVAATRMSGPKEELSYVIPISGRQSNDSVWDTATWQNSEGTTGDGEWASGIVRQVTDIYKIGSGGTSSAVALKITGPTQENVAWEVNAISFPHKSRRMR
jgi:hypothetical protein